MDQRAAAALLADREVEVMLEAPLAEAKEIVEHCLAAEIAVMLGKDDHCKKGCAPKLMVLARPEDAPRIQAVMRARWNALAEREGGTLPVLAPVGADSMPCLACGAAVPDVATECPDCGLAL